MPKTTKVIAVGNSAGIVLPEELLDRLKLQVGDTICLSETPFGVHLTPCDDQSLRELEATEKITRTYRDALRKLAD
jgi:putative addiction module antidote